MAIGKGESGRELFVRFNFTKWGEREFSVSRTVHEMNEERKASYLKRKKKTEKSKSRYYNKHK